MEGSNLCGEGGSGCGEMLEVVMTESSVCEETVYVFLKKVEKFESSSMQLYSVP